MSYIEDAVCDKIQQRAAVGVAKYGQGLERKDFGQDEWLLHLQQELMDGASYAEKAIVEIGELRALCEEILATLEINKQRGTLTSVGEPSLTVLLEAWWKRFERKKL
jgi:hypothetical protein